MKKLFLLLLATTMLVSCKSFYMLSAMPEESNQPKPLPALMPMMDMQTLSNVYGESITKSSVKSSESGRVIGSTYLQSGVASSTSVTYKHHLINDLNNYYVDYVRHKLCEKGDRRGYIVCKVLQGYNYMPIGAWWLGAYPGFGIPYLLGLPAGRAHAGFLLQVEIFDNNQNLIETYKSSFNSNVTIHAMYYGYSKNDALDRAAVIAFSTSLNEIYAKIAIDSEMLLKRL